MSENMLPAISKEAFALQLGVSTGTRKRKASPSVPRCPYRSIAYKFLADTKGRSRHITAENTAESIPQGSTLPGSWFVRAISKLNPCNSNTFTLSSPAQLCAGIGMFVSVSKGASL